MSKVKLGFISIVFLGINTIVGSGIFLLPNQVYAMVGRDSIWVIIFSALLVSCLAFCFAEACGWHSDKGGGTYIFAREAFGDFVGFEFGVLKYVSITAGWAAVSNAFVISLSAIFPIFKTQPYYGIGVAVFVAIQVILNLLGVGSVKRILNVLTVSKLAPMLIIILAGFFYINGANFSIDPMIISTQSGGATFAGAVLVMAFAFLGFDNAAAVSEDMKNPKHQLPRALSLAIASVSIIYIAIYMVSLGVLGLDLKATQTPVADVALRIFGRAGGSIVSTAIIVSIAGINMALAYTVPRYLCAMAKDKHLPSALLKTNRFNVPHIAIITAGVLTGILASSGSFVFLVQLLSFTEIAQYIPVCLGLFYFRKRHQPSPTQFILPFGPVIPIFTVIISLWILANSGTKQILWGLSGFLIGLPIYAYNKFVRRSI
ncbi:MAG: APC family permease [Brevinema sp.]